MPITRQVEYAMRTICYLAEADEESRTTTGGIARDTGIPASFLTHVVSMLHKAGLVQTSRGKRGGVSLSRLPADISLLNVVEAVHGPYVFYDPTLRDQDSSCLNQALMDIQNDLVSKMSRIKFSTLTDREP